MVVLENVYGLLDEAAITAGKHNPILVLLADCEKAYILLTAGSAEFYLNTT